MQHACERIGDDIGKRYEPARIGEQIDGQIAGRVDLESGSFAVVERSRDFTLLPWRDVLERNIGKAASGMMPTDGTTTRAMHFRVREDRNLQYERDQWAALHVTAQA